MPNVSISPVFNGFQFFDNNGEPLAGGKLFQYEGGSSSIQQTTYTDTTGNTPNANPIVFDSSGRISTDVWLENGLAYNLVITEADGTTVIDQVDNVIGVQASTPGNTPGVSVWNDVLDTPSFISGTQFSLPGNYAGEFAVGNRVKSELQTGIFVYGTVSAVTVAGGNTQVTLAQDSNPLTGLLSLVSWSSLTSTNRTVDAAAVAYNVPAAYTNTNTVGYQIKNNADSIASLNSRYGASQQVWTASGTNTYVVTITPAITSYTADSIFTIKFTNASTTTPITLNIDGVGAVPIVAYGTGGSTYSPAITAGQVGQLAYNGSQFVLTNPLPIAAGTPVSGMQVFFVGSHTFTVPAGVYNIKVTLSGAGGGGGPPDLSTPANGASGGSGGCGINYLAVVPGAQYAVVVGAGGTPFVSILQPATGGAASTFGGSIFVALGGGPVNTSVFPNQPGTRGTVSGLYDSLSTYVLPGTATPYGSGGLGGQTPFNNQEPGYPGICVIEW